MSIAADIRQGDLVSFEHSFSKPIWSVLRAEAGAFGMNLKLESDEGIVNEWVHKDEPVTIIRRR